MFRLVGPSTGLLICQLVIWLVVWSVGESFHFVFPAPKDPMAVAMSEMMQRIKTGNIQLKPVKSVSVQLSLLLLELLKTVLLFLFFKFVSKRRGITL